MLINCPRCGFEQPKDQYCAQCGVDVENFQIPPKPKQRPFYKSPIFFFIAFTLFAGGARLGLSFLSQSTPPSTNRLTKQSRPSGSFSYSSKQISETNTHQASLMGTPEVAPRSPDSAEKPASSNLRATEVPSNGDSSLAAKTESPQLMVYYVELSRSSLEILFNTSKNTGQFLEFNDYSAGILPNFKKLLNSTKYKLLRKELRTIENGKPNQWFYGIKDPQDSNIEIGLNTLFEANDIENGIIKANLEIQRTWRESLPTGGFEIQKKSFPAILEIGGGNGFFMSGIMPRQSNLESENELSDLEVYKILNSPDFRAGDSSFVIFFEFAAEN